MSIRKHLDFVPRSLCMPLFVGEDLGSRVSGSRSLEYGLGFRVWACCVCTC